MNLLTLLDLINGLTQTAGASSKQMQAPQQTQPNIMQGRVLGSMFNAPSALGQRKQQQYQGGPNAGYQRY